METEPKQERDPDFGSWWHKCGQQAVEQVIEKGEEDGQENNRV